MSSELHDALRRARVHLRTTWTEEQTIALVKALPRLQRRRANRRNALLGVGAALFAIGLAVARRDAAPTELRELPIATRTRAPSWSAIPLSRQTTLVTSQPSENRVSIQLDRGPARFSVPPEPKRLVRIVTAHVSIEVASAELVVDNRGAQVFVSVEHGLAQVTWGTHAVELGEGQSGLYPPRVAAPEAEQPSTPRPHHALLAPVVAQRPTPDLPPEDDPKGVIVAPPPVVPPAHPTVNEAAQLLASADEARHAHRPADAVAPLEALLKDHGDDPRASLAAFMLGRVLLDDLDRPREAVAAFVTAERLATHGVLIDDAMAREVEALARSGDAAAARARAEAYLARFPDGPRTKLVRHFGGLE